MAKTGGVFPDCFKRATLLLAALCLGGVACTKNPEAVPAGKSPAAPPATPAPPAAAPATPPASPPAGPSAMLSGIPGMDFSSLPPAAQRELANVLSDEFCYCGCPHTLGACLKQHTSCKHAKRMAKLAASFAAEGVPATEIINLLSKYYASFREPRADLKVDPRMCMGAANAPVTVAEFSDFECPFCAKARPVLEEFAKRNPTQVRFCYLPYPLAGHANAIPAGQAALWARDQGKFWEMHDALFLHQHNLAPAALPAIANQVGLPGAKLQEVLKSDAYKNELEGFRTQGNAAGITGTPSIFFNGRRFHLPPEQATLQQSLEDELEWRANNNAWAAD